MRKGIELGGHSREDLDISGFSAAEKLRFGLGWRKAFLSDQP